ncbi:hypothetical protein FHL15_005613 [Xylaria flabelliformis]|uniref:B30.2/SPRY domain-containing protein n=1 Tax=Xylaria flabelliformis TaxID=2512241 RepID=A0A553I0C2_9PEZI|nr:hypothetical protein FHL15_005613 [Xylaria flabelliformis]
MRNEDVSCDGRHEDLWRFAKGKVNADGAVKQILATRNTPNLILREFIRRLSSLDSQTHQLRPAFSTTDTLDYALGRATLAEWKSNSIVRILCISGLSGSGTTSFASWALGDLMESDGMQDITVLSFVFSRSDPRARTLFSLCLSLCRQLISFQPQLFLQVSAAARFWTNNGPLTTECLWILLCSMVVSLEEKGGSVYCLVCCIDQCIPSSTNTVRRMEELTKFGKGRFKLLYTQLNHNHPDVSGSGSERGQRYCIALDSASQEMMLLKEQHIRFRIQDLIQENTAWYGLTDSALTQARNYLSESPYLLIKVNMILLQWTTRGCTRKQIKEKIEELPRSLLDCYNEIIRTIKNDCRFWVLLALRWITYAARPMRPTELAVAVALGEVSGPSQQQHDSKINYVSEIHDLLRSDILGYLHGCMAPLIKVENNRVSFIHASFRDFLLTTELSLGSSDAGDSEDHEKDEDCYILYECLQYLDHVGKLALKSMSNSNLQYPLRMDHEYGLLTYATLYWPEHFLKTKSHKTAREFVLKFLEDDERVRIWADLYQQLNPSLCKSSSSVNSPLRIVCKFGLSSLVGDGIRLIEDLTESEESVGEYEKSKCFDLAVENGHHDIVQTLLGIGIRSKDALSLAAAQGFADIVETILAIDPHGINRTNQSQYAPIHHAICAGQKHVVSLLLERDADPNLQIIEDDSTLGPSFPLSEPSDSDSYWVSDSDEGSNSGSLQQNTLTDIVMESTYPETSLQLAALTGQVEVIELLLSRSADLHAISSTGYDALKYAAVGGFVGAVILLLERGADRDKPSRTDGNTALHLAAAHGHVKVVKQFMQDAQIGGHPIHSTNAEGLTPVHLAAREGHLDILNLVFGIMDNVQNSGSANAKSPDKEDNPRASPTKSRRSSRHLDPVTGVRRRPTRELSPLRKGCATSTRQGLWVPASKDGYKSALELALERGHFHVVRVLLDRTIETSLQKAATDHYGNTALHIAAKGGHSRTIEVMLKNPKCAKLFLVNNPKRTDGMTPLHLAAKTGHAEVIKVLLRYHDYPDSRDKKGWTALHHAARRGYLNCVDELLLHKSDTNMEAEGGETALHMAAKYGHLSVIRRLVSQNKDTLWIRDGNSTMALDLIVARGALKEVKQFVRMLEDVCGKDFERQGTPLHTAAVHRHMENLRFLLDKGWKCNQRESDGSTPLHEAVRSGFLEGVECLLEDIIGCDVNSVDQYGNSPLHYAQQLSVVQILLHAGAKNDEKNREGETPSFLAAWHGREDILQELFNSNPKPDIGTMDNGQWTLLHAAYDSPQIIEMLLKRGANPDVQSEGGITPLSLALERGCPETAKILIKSGADPNMSEGFVSSPLCCVFQISSRDLVEIVKSLVEKGADLLKEEDGVTALHLAVRENEQEVVDYIVDTLNNKEPKEIINNLYSAALCEAVSTSEFNPTMASLLLSQGLDINKATSSGYNALHAACAIGTVDAVKWLLLDKNADINAKSSRYGTALCAAIESTTSVQDKVLLLLDHRRKPEINLSNENDPTPLQRAVSKGEASVVKLLVEHKADVNITRPGCDTPLNEAIAHRFIPLEIIDMLLKNGADIHKPGVKGMLPIHIAANSNRLDVMKLLYSEGAHAYTKDNKDLTPLMYGLLSSSVEVVKFLLSQNDWNPEDVDTSGRTPLIVATILGDRPNLKQLLSNGFKTVSRLNARDVYGKTALAYAAQMDYIEMVQILIEGGAKPNIADCRNYSPLYWAVRMSSQEITETIIDAMSKIQGDTTEHWNIAIHGALASGKRQALERLLDRYDVDTEQPTPDGWTPLFTASMYKSHRMEDILREKLGISRGEYPPSLKRPSCWHPEDKHPGINIDPKNSTILATDGTDRYLNLIEVNRSKEQFGLARADYPMLPLLNGRVYYFEVTLNAVGNGFMAIGICDDQVSPNRMLGWDSGAWGFHSDDGKVFEDGQMSWTGAEYSEPYGKAGITIGCGVNFDENIAFYTRNGAVIGRAFTEIRGKLYPAVSFDFCEQGWRVSAVFPGEDGKSDYFMFKGDLESDTTLVSPKL